MTFRIALVGAIAVLLAACTTAPPVRVVPADAAQQACLEWFARLDDAMWRAGVADAQEARIPGYPHLRVNRFLAALAHDGRVDDARFARDAWPALRALDRAARAAELGNLPPAALAELGTTRADAVLQTEACASGALSRLHPSRTALSVPDDYSDAQRLLGAYAVARYPFTEGVQRQLADVRAAFARPLVPPVGGKVARYAVPEANGQGHSAQGTLAALLEQHQPVFEKEITQDDDLPGALVWDAALSSPAVQRDQPAVYRHVAYARYRGATLTQLVYTVWFGARPANGAGDWLAGHLDGLIWRVTLDAKGEALIYDTIHPCGCYHTFFPTPRATPMAAPPDEPEWAFVPQVLGRSRADERVMLRIATRTHFLERVTFAPRGEAEHGAVALRVLPQDSLRALPVLGLGAATASSAATHSAYGPDGLVPGTERAERFFFWPMGIASAGQMRQWGRHATAFVGRRHFDDADLLEKRFILDLDE